MGKSLDDQAILQKVSGVLRINYMLTKWRLRGTDKVNLTSTDVSSHVYAMLFDSLNSVTNTG